MFWIFLVVCLEICLAGNGRHVRKERLKFFCVNCKIDSFMILNISGVDLWRFVNIKKKCELSQIFHILRKKKGLIKNFI